MRQSDCAVLHSAWLILVIVRVHMRLYSKKKTSFSEPPSAFVLKHFDVGGKK